MPNRHAVPFRQVRRGAGGRQGRPRAHLALARFLLSPSAWLEFLQHPRSGQSSVASQRRTTRKGVVVVLGPPGAETDAGVSALRALPDVKVLCHPSPELAAAAVRGERAALAVATPGVPEAWIDEVVRTTSAMEPHVPLLVLVHAGQAVPARWIQAGVATLLVPTSVLALARLVSLLLARRGPGARP